MILTVPEDTIDIVEELTDKSGMLIFGEASLFELGIANGVRLRIRFQIIFHYNTTNIIYTFIILSHL